MKRTERLFHLLERLRSASQPITAGQLAVELGTSDRTIYRDIKLLIEQGLPIMGETGIGYVLDKEFNAPALQFSQDELEILSIGLRFVYREGDWQMRRTAELVLSKIQAGLKGRVDFGDIDLFVAGVSNHCVPFLSAIRKAIRERKIIQIEYRSLEGDPSHRRVKPLALQFFHNATLFAGYCELRKDYRHFRVDRIETFHETDEAFREEHYKLRRAFFEKLKQE